MIGWMLQRGGSLSNDWDMLVPFVTLFVGFLAVRQFSRPLLILLIGPVEYWLGIIVLYPIAGPLGYATG